MARRRYYRVKRVYPKQKWLPVNNEVVVSGVSDVASNSYVVTVQPITENPTRNSADGGGNVNSATILKVGRIKYKGLISGSSSVGVTYIVGVAYIPEGYVIDQTVQSNTTLGTTFFYRHPEWIMCWTRFDYTNSGQGNDFSLSSRLKRNLNSGDQLVVFRICVNINNTAQLASTMIGTISYVCRSN